MIVNEEESVLEYRHQLYILRLTTTKKHIIGLISTKTTIIILLLFFLKLTYLCLVLVYNKVS